MKSAILCGFVVTICIFSAFLNLVIFQSHAIIIIICFDAICKCNHPKKVRKSSSWSSRLPWSSSAPLGVGRPFNALLGSSQRNTGSSQRNNALPDHCPLCTVHCMHCALCTVLQYQNCTVQCMNTLLAVKKAVLDKARVKSCSTFILDTAWNADSHNWIFLVHGFFVEDDNILLLKFKQY